MAVTSRRRRAARAGTTPVPLRSELLGLEHLEERARILAVSFSVTRDPRKSPSRPLAALDEDARVLRDAYHELVQAVRRGEDVPPAAEWLLDNFHEVEAAIRDVRRNLPRHFYRDLPKLAARDQGGRARIHALAVEFIRHSDARFDLHRLTRFLLAFQTVAPLTLGELWAWPSMLKLCLLTNLAALSEEILVSRDGEAEADRYFLLFESIGDKPLPPLPERPTTSFVLQILRRMRELAPRVGELRIELDRRLAELGLETDAAVRAEHQGQTMGHASVSNSITSLRLVSSLDWNRAVEKVSLMEQILQRDPAGVYPRMDFASRDRYRQAVEELAEPTGDAQVRVALRVVESAREGQEKYAGDARCAHVGHYLIGPGRRGFETDVGFVPRLVDRFRRPIFHHATTFYLGSIALLTGAGVAAAWLFAWAHGATP
ncbi:MAG: carbohydrate-binding protein, partial [Candidatus Eisenbacteria bacterium]